MATISVRIKQEFKRIANPQKAKLLAGFFKTGKGQYAEGDRFWGVTVPETRIIAKRYSMEATLKDIQAVLKNGLHEERLCALIILVEQFKKADEKKQKKIYDFYLANTKYINNWDLVDLSVGTIVGGYLHGKPKDVLFRLATSRNLWERRIAIIATFYDIYKGRAETTLKIADILLHDKHDLIHKAVGWMLREVGKRCSRKELEKFLKPRYKKMPRTMLRYAVEHFESSTRQKYLKGTI